MLLWVLIGIILVAIVWALMASSGKKATSENTFYTPPPMPEAEKPVLSHTQHWKDASTTGVSENFGKGGDPTGVSKDQGGLAASTGDDWLRNAQPFEPRATKLNLDTDMEEVSETT